MAQIRISEIVEAIADSKGVEPRNLDIVLADYIDLEAITELEEHSNGPWTLTFELPEHSVTVTSEGEILADSNVEKDWISA